MEPQTHRAGERHYDKGTNRLKKRLGGRPHVFLYLDDMGKSRIMGAGNASATLYKSNPNLNTGGGYKKQGITSRVGLNNWENREVQTQSNGIGRFKLVCMNQLGGVGPGMSMFGGRWNRADGVHCPRSTPTPITPVYMLVLSATNNGITMSLNNNILTFSSVPYNLLPITQLSITILNQNVIIPVTYDSPNSLKVELSPEIIEFISTIPLNMISFNASISEYLLPTINITNDVSGIDRVTYTMNNRNSNTINILTNKTCLPANVTLDYNGIIIPLIYLSTNNSPGDYTFRSDTPIPYNTFVANCFLGDCNFLATIQC
jgi:hypothetical protein